MTLLARLIFNLEQKSIMRINIHDFISQGLKQASKVHNAVAVIMVICIMNCNFVHMDNIFLILKFHEYNFN